MLVWAGACASKARMYSVACTNSDIGTLPYPYARPPGPLPTTYQSGHRGPHVGDLIHHNQACHVLGIHVPASFSQNKRGTDRQRRQGLRRVSGQGRT